MALSMTDYYAAICPDIKRSNNRKTYNYSDKKAQLFRHLFQGHIRLFYLPLAKIIKNDLR